MVTITNWGIAIISALANALSIVLAFIPHLIGFLLILLAGWIVATLVSKGLTFLFRKAGFDRLGNRIGLARFEQNMHFRMDAAGILGKVVFWFVFLIFLIPAADALGVPAISNILDSIVTFLPNVFVAILVLFLGTWLAAVVADIVRGLTGSSRVGNPNVFANIARYAIIGFAVLIALEQLDIAPALLNELFGAIVAGGALALALAFGLGGREAAQRWLARRETAITSANAQNPSATAATSSTAQNSYATTPTTQNPYATAATTPTTQNPYATVATASGNTQTNGRSDGIPS